MYVCMYVCMHECMYVFMYVYVYTYMYVCMYVHICVYICMYACMYACVYVCVRARVCECVCACVCRTLHTWRSEHYPSGGQYFPQTLFGVCDDMDYPFCCTGNFAPRTSETHSNSKSSPRVSTGYDHKEHRE